MCGIVGFAGFREPGLIQRMCDILLHRGPDGEGIAELAEASIAIGMRRLAIIDLKTGDQPFVSSDRRVFLVFNGEIYNFLELCEELRNKGHAFRTRSDTEVLLAAYLEWGDEAWPRLQGMFAVAIVDLREAVPRLIIVRDRVGMKPLYYVERGGKFLFASEIKALLAWSDLPREVSIGAVRDYLALRYVPGPDCLLKGIRKLPAGYRLVFADGDVQISRWWAPPGANVVEPGMSADDAKATLGSALRRAVRRHLVSDVPVGAFLSGGIDSSVIVALMAEASTAPVHTFSIGFPDFPDDDRQRAAITAKALGTDHSPVECRPSDMSALPEIAWHLDEPVGDAIVVPMYVLSREARRQVKVVLSGEGADEVLGGYMFHRRLVQLERLRRLLPRSIWGLVAAAVAQMPAGLLDRAFDYPGALGSAGRAKLTGFLGSVGRVGLMELYRSSISLFDDGDVQAASANHALRDARGSSAPCDAEPSGTALQRLVRAQFPDWLPDDILMKTDKMTMAHSLEGRIPFMDDEVVVAAARIPDRHKMSRRMNKKVLRDFAAELLPPELVASPKRAFYVPLEAYIRTPAMIDLLRWALDPRRIRRRGLFRPEWAEAMLNSSRDSGFLPLKRLFSIMMLELWFERFCPDASWI